MRWENNIKTGITDMGCEWNCMELTLDCVQWQALVFVVLNVQILLAECYFCLEIITENWLLTTQPMRRTSAVYYFSSLCYTDAI
jgi:hypothetical protein